MLKKILFIGSLASIVATTLHAQTNIVAVDKNGNPININGDDQIRPITTAVPFLNITPDARSGALGDAGVAISADANSSHWNIAKLASIDKKMGVALSYTPWLRKLVQDMSLSYLTAYYKPTKEQAFSFSMRYFNLGELQYTDAAGTPGILFRPKEYAFSLGYSRKLTENLSIGGSGKFIYSNLVGSLAGSDQSKNGVAGAVDVGIYYQKDLLVGGKNSNLALGATITDLGSKISYTSTGKGNFIPTNLRVGTAYTTEIDPYNKFTFILEASKLMVPSTPVYADSSSDPNNKKLYIVNGGKDPSTVGLFSGIFGSFSDAPGGFTEELKEIVWTGAVEYWYNDLFAARAGYFNESKMKGNRKYITMGFGLKYQSFGLDFAYLVPMGNRNSPLAETLRFTLLFNFEGKQVEESVTE